MKVATLLFDTTSHSHFFTPSTASGTLISMSCFTFTWHPRRQFACCSLREKCTFSVGSISPPPASTWQRHCAHEPPPPQAEGKKILFSASVDSRLEPTSTSTSFSPLMVTFTFPEGERYLLAIRSIMTSRRITPRKTPTLASIKDVIVYFLFINYNFNPEKHIKAIAISPTVMNVIPSPLSGAGTSE